VHFRRTLVLQGCKGKAEARLERSSDFVSTGDAGIKFRRTAHSAAWFGADGRRKVARLKQCRRRRGKLFLPPTPFRTAHSRAPAGSR
jgi:hypothetical protein